MEMPTAAQLAEKRVEDDRKSEQAARDIAEIFGAHGLSITAAGNALAIAWAAILSAYPKDIRPLARRCFDGTLNTYVAILDGDHAALVELHRTGSELVGDAKAKLAEIVGPDAARAFGR